MAQELKKIKVNDEEYIVTDEQAQINFEKLFVINTNAMISNVELTAGNVVKTLGYHSINDGGEGVYIIREKEESDIEDNGKIHFLVNGLVAELILQDSMINVKQYGAKGDGSSDDLAILQKANDNNSHITLFVPNGLYMISNTFYISNNNNLLLDENAEIKASTEMEYLIVYNKQDFGAQNDRAFNKFVRGGILNGANKVTEAILSLQGYFGFYVEKIKFLNMKKYGFKSKIEGTQGNELFAKDLYFRNYSPIAESVAIYNNANDGMYENIIIRDTHGGIISKDGQFSNIHGWIGYPEILAESFFIKSIGTNVMVSLCYCDTYQYAFVSGYNTMHINSSLVYFNTAIYTEELRATNKPVIFHSVVDSNGAYGIFRATNNNIRANGIDIVANDNKNAKNYFLNNYFDDNAKVDLTCYTDYYTYKVTAEHWGEIDNAVRPGSYAIREGATSGTIPGSVKFGIMQVLTYPKYPNLTPDDKNNTNDVLQIFYPNMYTANSSPIVYLRNRIGAEWQGWKKFSLTNT